MKTVDKILVPVNFTEDSQRIFKKAVEIARYTKAEIHLLHVYTRPVLHGKNIKQISQRLVVCLERSKLKRLERMHALRFNKLINAVPESEDVKISIIKEKGIVVDKIKKIANQTNADLIVMGTKGRHGFEEYWGTKGSELISKVKVPLLIIPYQSKETTPIKIAVAYDMKRIKNLEDLNIIKVFLALYDAEIHIINVASSGEKYNKKALNNLDVLRSQFEGFNTVIHTIKDYDVERGIAKYLKEHNISLVTILHRSEGFFKKMIHESIAKKMAFHSKVPVLTLEEH